MGALVLPSGSAQAAAPTPWQQFVARVTAAFAQLKAAQTPPTTSPVLPAARPTPRPTPRTRAAGPANPRDAPATPVIDWEAQARLGASRPTVILGEQAGTGPVCHFDETGRTVCTAGTPFRPALECPYGYRFGDPTTNCVPYTYPPTVPPANAG